MASVAKNLGTAAFTAVTLPLLLERFVSKDSEAYLYSALFLNNFFMNEAMAGANEVGRQLGRTADGWMEQALIRQYVATSYKQYNKMANGISDYLGGGWRPTLPRKAALMAETMRGRNNDARIKYNESQANLAVVDKAIDKYLENGKPGDVDAFENFLHHLKAWEFMASAPLPHEVANLSHEEKNGDSAKLAQFDAAQETVKTMAPATIREELSSFMTDWRLSTLPGTAPSKGFIALAGDTELPDGTDLAEEMCKKLTQKDPVIVTADHLNEFIDVVVPKEGVPRVKQKTADPKEAIGPFLKWIESGNAACPIVVKDVDFKNSKHTRLVGNLRKATGIDIHYDDIKGAKFTVDLARTRFILCTHEAIAGSGAPPLVAQAVVGSPSKEDRHKVLDLMLKKQRRDVLDKLAYTEEQKNGIEDLIRQDRHANLIIESSVKRNLSYPLMRETINKILIEVSSGYKRLAALQGAAGTSAEGETGPSLSVSAKEAFDNALEKYIKDRFKAFPKTEGKAKKDSKSKGVADAPPEEKNDLQAQALELDSRPLSRARDILSAHGYNC